MDIWDKMETVFWIIKQWNTAKNKDKLQHEMKLDKDMLTS